MSTPLPNPPPGFDELSVDEQIDYLQSLWDRVATAPENVPVPAWHREIIRKRLAELASDPSNTIPWEKAKEEITGRLREE